MKHFTKQNNSQCTPDGNTGILNQQYYLYFKIAKFYFTFEIISATKYSSLSNVHYINFYRIFFNIV